MLFILNLNLTAFSFLQKGFDLFYFFSKIDITKIKVNKKEKSFNIKNVLI